MHKINLVLIAIALAGCSSGGGDTAPAAPITPPPTPAAFVFEAALITPTDINPAINAGAFAAGWSVTDGGSHIVTLYVSADGVLNGADIEIYSINCGAAVLDAACTINPAVIGCAFDNNNMIYCDNPASAVDLSAFVAGGLPMAASIIFESCESLLNNCITSAVPVTFQ